MYADKSLVPLLDDLINLVEFRLGITKQRISADKTIKNNNNMLSSLMRQNYECLFDVAANLSHFNNVQAIINKAITCKVTKFFFGGYTLKSNYKNIDLCNKYPNNLYCGVGIHPYNVNTYDLNETMSEISDILLQNKSNNNIKVIGETGLDFSEHFPAQNIQTIWFEKHIELALKLNLKLYIHERLAHKQLIEILINKYKFKACNVLIHCFTGNKQELLDYIQMGFNVSISGYITKKKHGAILRDIIHSIPLSKLMIETDAPYMLITDKRIKKLKLLEDKNQNEPAVLPFVLEAIHKHYNGQYSIDEIATITTKNAIDFFEIDNV